ncbi:MAG: hypothetical protein JXB62_21740 [Pirellulales bacterium]|nr:hypothetical protein [Pirellulales bacterium]
MPLEASKLVRGAGVGPSWPLAASVVLLAIWLPPWVPGAETAVDKAESVADDLHPRPWQWGWEIRTRHLIVFCTTNRQQATWAARHAEVAFADAARLADHWTDRHGHSAPEPRAIGVLVTDRPPEVRQPPNPPTRSASLISISDVADSTDVCVALRGGGAELQQHLPQLRREVFRAMLRTTGQDAGLPEWVKEGLATYLSGEKLLAPAERGVSDAWLTRSDSAGDLRPEDRRQAAWLVRYLIEGDDARHAEEFFTAIAATLAHRPPVRFSAAGWDESVMRFTRRTYRGGQPLEVLVRTAAVGNGFSQWLAAENAEKPVGESIRPRVREFMEPGAKNPGAENSEAPPSDSGARQP